MELLKIEERSLPALTGSFHAEDSSAIERAVTAEDIAGLDQYEIEDFSCDFSEVEIPAGEISDQQMSQIVDRFFDGIEART